MNRSASSSDPNVSVSIIFSLCQFADFYKIMQTPPNPDLQFFFFNDTATTEIYTSVHTLSLHDALPICDRHWLWADGLPASPGSARSPRSEEHTSELQSRTLISYAVFCLKKKNIISKNANRSVSEAKNKHEQKRESEKQ